MDGYWSIVFVVVFFTALNLLPTLAKKLRIAKLKKWDFNWYRSEFPHLVKNGSVTCYKCNGHNIGTERLLNQTFLRGHVCRQCGTTLYYSQE